MTDEDEIIAFIKDSEDGRRWVDLTGEFENKRGWSHGKFVNHWKKTEPLREQRLTEKGKRYFIKGSCDKEATKSVLVRDLREQEISETEVPPEFVFDFFFSRIKSQVDVARGVYANPLKRLKIIGKKEEFYGNFSAHILAQLYSKYFKINILHPKGQKPPNLDIIFDEKNITSGKELLVSFFAHVAGEYEKEMGKMLPFHLLLTFNPPTSSHENFQQELESQIESLYQKWLLEFNQQHSEKTKNEFSSELIKYTGLILQKRHKALQKS